MKTEDLDLESGKIKELINEGRKFWKVDTRFFIENSSEGEGVASYNPFFDRIEFHYKHIAMLRKKFPEMIIGKEIEFAILHELGHAKEARIYEENSFWPYTRAIAVPINSSDRFAREINLIDFTFFNGIDDFKVEKTLFENGYPRPKTIRFHKIFPYIERIVETVGFIHVDDMMNAFMNMPQTMSSLRFCKEISADERKTIEKYYVEVFGMDEEWKRVIGILDTLRFGDVKNTIDVVSRLLNELFDFNLSLHSINKEELEQKIRNELNLCKDFSLPSFWIKKATKHI